MSQLKTSSASLIWFLTACTAHTPSPEVTPYPSQPRSAETIPHTNPANSRWEFAPSEQHHSYQSTSYTIIHELSAIRPRVDTLQLNTHFTVHFDELQTPATISGHIDSMTTAQNIPLSSKLNNPLSRVEFTGQIENGELTLELSPNQADCSSPMTSILGEIRPAITTHSRQVSRTSVWTDSISTVTCSGNGIPTTLKTVRSYRVLGETIHSQTQVLIIERTEATHFNGSGSQEQHQVQIEGIGTGISRIYLDTTTGATIGVENTQKIDTTIRSSGRVQHFIQDITQRIERTS
jgi:hypothetical protein